MKKKIITNVTPTGVSTAWEVKYGNGCKQILVLDSSFIAEEVARFVKDYYPGESFVVTAVEIGVFNLRDRIPIENKYKTKSINQNEETVIVSKTSFDH